MPLITNGWTLLYHPVCGDRYASLRDEARTLRRELAEAEYTEHPVVKLAAAVHRLITEVVPADPNAPEFRLRGALARFRRAKGHGLPPRYRLFWVFSDRVKTIIFVYLNDEATLHKAGARTDPYAVFRRIVARGEIGADFATNLGAWRRAHGEE